MPTRIKIRLAEILHMDVWNTPGKYLGLPSEWGRSKISALNWIKEKVLAKLDGWKVSLLNQAGKEVLIKAVVQAIPAYAMAMVRFPKNFCKSLCAAVARFYWSSNGKSRGIHWKKWEVLTKNKSDGGLGFKDFADMNSALLAKQAWRVIQNPDSLWVRVLKATYFPREEFIRANRTRNGSWMWGSLCHGRDILKMASRWAVGTGERILIIEDNWLISGLKIDEEIPPNILKVADILDSTNRAWDIGKIRRSFSPAIAIQIFQTPIAW